MAKTFLFNFAIFVFFLFVLNSSILASNDYFIDSIKEVKQYSSVSLPQSGSNGSSAWNYCNITTIYDPNHNPIIKDVAMTKRGSVFNYTLPGSYTNLLGIYIVEGICGDGVHLKSFAYTFTVTTTGGSSSISLWISLILVIIAIIFLVLAIVLNSEYIGFICGVIFIVSGIYVLIYGFGNMFDMYTKTIGIVLLSLGILIFFISAFYNYDDENASGFKKILGLESSEEDKDESDYFVKKSEED